MIVFIMTSLLYVFCPSLSSFRVLWVGLFLRFSVLLCAKFFAICFRFIGGTLSPTDVVHQTEAGFLKIFSLYLE